MQQKHKITSFTVDGPSQLMKFLLAKMPEKRHSTIKSLLTHRQVSVNNQIITQYDHPVHTGQQITINLVRTEVGDKYHGLKILFEDEHLIIIEKDAGLLSIASEKEKHETAYYILSEHVKKANRRNRIFIIHRLDREASGIMMFAKSLNIQEIMQKNWKTAGNKRKYTVIVEGKPEKDEGTIISWLKENAVFLMYSCKYDNGGQMAVTHYKVLMSIDDFSMLEVVIDTGRKNQIRVHMQELKHSIVGDKKYGATSNPIYRMGLHAHMLSFRHPVTEEEMYFESPLPKSFLKLFNKSL
jgi:23S rRNA pseudouridine1911/1915/1917 synthase